MPRPSFNLTILDGQVGNAAPVDGDNVIILACTSAGTTGAAGAQFFAANQIAALVAAFGDGPGVQLASRFLNKGRAAGLLKLNATTAGSIGSVTALIPGGSTATLALTGSPIDYKRLIIKCTNGGAIGTAGIMVCWSYDNGDTDFSTPVALPTSGIIVVGNSGITATFGTSTHTMVAGDTWSAVTVAPKWNATDLAAGLAALKSLSFEWDWIYIVGACSATEAATVASALDGFQSASTYTGAMVETAQQLALSDSAYQAALIADYSAFSHKRMLVAAGDCRIFSPIDQSTYLRPAGWAIALKAALVDNTLTELGEVALTSDNTGPLDCNLFGPATSNNPAAPIGHNENANPGLDAPTTFAGLGFATLCTWPKKGNAAYCFRGRMMAPQGSDFETWRLRRIMDVACNATQSVLTDEIQATPPLNPNGTLSTTYANYVQSQCEQAISNNLQKATGAAISGRAVTVDTSANFSITKNLVVGIAILPNGDVETISESIGFVASLPTSTTNSSTAGS